MRISDWSSDVCSSDLLVGGRARFSVAHESARPFRVEAAGSETTALGTIFEIDLTGRRPVVHLVEGSVEVRATANPQAPLSLSPGQRAAIEEDAPLLIETPPGGETATTPNPERDAGRSYERSGGTTGGSTE